MKSAKLYNTNDIRVVEEEAFKINDNEILVKTLHAAICGSDLRMIANGYKNVDEDHPLTLGHEFCGTICEVGKNVKGYKVGQNIAVAPNFGCGMCDFCINGDTHLCSQYKAFGINIPGGFAEYIKIPQEAIIQGNVVIIDGEYSPSMVLAEPMSCVVNGQDKISIMPLDTVLVIGAGPIGIMHALLAKIKGASKVIISDVSEDRLKQCTMIDSFFTVMTSDNLKEKIFEETNGNGVDVCITACSVAQVQALSLELMAMNGRILFFGGLPAGKDSVTISTNHIHYKQLTISGSTRGNNEQFRRVIKMMDSGLLKLDGIISKSFEISDFKEAIEYSKNRLGLKTIISFN